MKLDCHMGMRIGLALTDLEVAQHQIMKIPDSPRPTDSSDMHLTFPCNVRKV